MLPSASAHSCSAGCCLIAFLIVETRAAEPILPLWVFSRRLLSTTSLVSLGVGAIVIGLSAYVPTYLEGSLGATPIVAGLALAALTLGWPVSASQAGRLYLRIGFRNTALIGLGFATLGSLSLAAFAHTPSLAIVAVSCFVIGIGMGLCAVPTLIAAQSSVEWNQRARRHRRQPVLALDRQRRRRGHLRRDRQRADRLVGGCAHLDGGSDLVVVRSLRRGRDRGDRDGGGGTGDAA